MTRFYPFPNLISLLLVSFAPGLLAQDPSSDFVPNSRPISVYRQQLERDGVVVELTIHQADKTKVSRPMQEGDDVIFTFNISDKATSEPITGAFPAGWLARRTSAENGDDAICRKKAETFVSGSIFSAAELDLNVYYVLTLNNDNTLSVVDPLFGFGSSKLLAMVELPARGFDWDLSPDGDSLFVSMPEIGKMAMVETRTWKVAASLELGGKPTRTAVQPDGHYVWVADESDAGGVLAVEIGTQKIAARIATGPGVKDFAFSPDSAHLWVSNALAGTVSVIDVRSLRKIVDIPTGKHPVSLAYSARSASVYVSHSGDGKLVAIDGKRHEISQQIQLDPGLEQVSFAPGGMYGFIVNPVEKTVHVLDVASNRIVQTGDMDGRPDQVSYSDELAYIRQKESEIVWMVPLATIGREGSPLAVVDFPGGQHPPGKSQYPTPAAGIVQVPGAAAVLVANPEDESIYFYMEGMAAPMGNFNNYGKQPRAVKVVDRSLQETRPGTYQTVGTLAEAGFHDMVFFMDAPRTIMCFDVPIDPDPELEAARRAVVQIQPRYEGGEIRAGQKVSLPFQLKQHELPMEGLTDASIMVYLTPGIWHTRQTATHRGDGVYSIDFVPPQPGYYYAHISSEALGIGYNNPRYMVLDVKPAQNSEAADQPAAANDGR